LRGITCMEKKIVGKYNGAFLCSEFEYTSMGEDEIFTVVRVMNDDFEEVRCGCIVVDEVGEERSREDDTVDISIDSTSITSDDEDSFLHVWVVIR
jgi:hypothetical protein